MSLVLYMVIEKVKMKVKPLSRIQLFATPWTVAYHAPPSKGFSRQEYWMGCHFLLYMVLVNNLISFSFLTFFCIFTFHSFIVIQFFWHHLFRRLLSPLYILAYFIWQRLIDWRCRLEVYVCLFFGGLSILFQWSMCLFLCQNNTILMIVVL